MEKNVRKILTGAEKIVRHFYARTPGRSGAAPNIRSHSTNHLLP